MPEHEILLGVNVDHIATLRQARGTAYPDPVQHALQVERAGADSITLHLREDRRHIQDDDVYRLKQCKTRPMNLEMAVTDEMLGIAEQVQPEYCCLVPEKREELTTEGGLDVVRLETQVAAACHRLVRTGVKASLFIDADEQQIDAAVRCGAPAIELHTGHYADAVDADERAAHLEQIRSAAGYAHSKGLQVNAGHGLNLDNLADISAIPEIVELNIGHALIADAVSLGLDETVSRYLELMRSARRG